MEEKISEALRERGCKKSSIELYLCKLRQLSGKEYSDLNFLGEERVMNIIKGKKTANTQYNYLNACNSVLKCFPEYEEIGKKYSGLVMLHQKEMKKVEEENRGEKNERESKNWIEWEEVMKRHSELEEQTKGFRSKGERLTGQQYELLLRYVVLSLYTMLPPRRNRDYHWMKIVNKESSLRYNTESGNYFIIDKGVFLFGDYKTVDSHGIQEIKVPEELMKVLMEYIKFRPKYVEYGESGKKKINWRNQGNLLLKYDGSIVDSDNYMTRLLNRIFGRNIACGMLRHSYVSKMYRGINPKEMFEVADAMGHSPQMALGTYAKV
jgi:hypothetical protein